MFVCLFAHLSKADWWASKKRSLVPRTNINFTVCKWNIILKYICLNWKIYLFNLQNVFVLISKWMGFPKRDFGDPLLPQPLVKEKKFGLTHQYQLYWNIVLKYICLNCKMYLSKLQNVFVKKMKFGPKCQYQLHRLQNEIWFQIICLKCEMYFLKFGYRAHFLFMDEFCSFSFEGLYVKCPEKRTP